jgi:hypothetical protein
VVAFVSNEIDKHKNQKEFLLREYFSGKLFLSIVMVWCLQTSVFNGYNRNLLPRHYHWLS